MLSDLRALAETVAEKESNTPKVKKYSKGKVKYNVKSELNSRQQASVEVIEKLADMFNITFNLYESTLNENGERSSVMPNGKKTTANGYYMNGEIYIDINAGNKGQGAMLYTVAHELTHYIREWSPKKFKILADFLVEQYESKGKSVDYYVNKQMEKARKSGNKNMKYSEAFEEFVADSMEKMLTDQNAVEKLAMLRTKDKSVFDKLREGIQKLVDKVKQEYAKLTPDSAEGRIVATMTDVFSDIQDLFLEALDDASNNFQKAEKNTITDDGVQYSEREIIGLSGKNYGIGVYLDSDELTGLTESERKDKVKNIVINNLAGKHFLAYDNNQNIIDIQIAKNSDTYKNKKGKKRKIIEELYKKNNNFVIKQEAIVLVDELIAMAKYNKSKAPKYPHGWLDNYGRNNWEYWTVFIQEKNKTVWEATLNVANSSNGKKVLYDINPIKKVEGPVESVPTTTNNRLSQEKHIVNNNSMQENENNAKVKFSERGQSVYKLLGENQRLQKENEILSDTVEYLEKLVKMQGPISASKIINRESVKSIAKDLKKNTGSKINLSNLENQLNLFYNYILSSDEHEWNDILTRASWIANDILNEVPESTQRNEYAQEILSYLRATNITLNNIQRAEVENIYDSYNAYRKRLMGSITISQKGTSLDSVWQDLAEQYPDTFSKDTNPADMPLELADIIYTLRSSQEIIAEFDSVEQLRNLAERIYNTYWDLSVAETAINQLPLEYRLKVKELRNQHANLMKEIVDRYENKLTDQKAYSRDMVNRVRQRSALSHKKQMLKYKEDIQDAKLRAIERRDRTEAQRKIKKIEDRWYSRLTKPTKEKNIPIQYQSLVCDLLEDINYNTVGKKKLAKVAEKMHNPKTKPQELADLEQYYERLVKKDEEQNSELSARISQLEKIKDRANMSLGNKIVADMNETTRANILKKKKLDVVKNEFVDDDNFDFDSLENEIKSKVEKLLVPKFKKMGYLKEYSSNEVDVTFDFTLNGLRKSLHSQLSYGGNYADFTKAILNIEKLLNNAVLVEMHSDKAKGTKKENQRLKQVFVLMSALQDGNSIIPVQFEVKEYIDNNNRLYLAVAMTKIEPDVVGDTVQENQARTILLSGSTISIYDLFSKINPADKNFLKYVPDMFLDDEQKKAKDEAIKEQVEKYGKVETDPVEQSNIADFELDEALVETIESTKQLVGKRAIADLNSFEMDTLYKTLKMVDSYITSYKEGMLNGRKVSMDTIAEKIWSEMESSSKQHKKRLLSNVKTREFMMSLASPKTFLDYLGSDTLIQLYDEFVECQNQFSILTQKAKMFYATSVKKYGADKWKFDKYQEFSLIGFEGTEKVKLSLGEIMSLYAYSKREQARPHIEEGGFVQEKIKDSVEKFEKFDKAGFIQLPHVINEKYAHKLTDAELGSIINSLTKEQKDFVDDLVSYLSTVMGEAGNKVSRMLYGVDLFTEDYYLPIITSELFRKLSFIEKSSKYSLVKNVGFSKTTVDHAHNPIILQDFIELWSNHVVHMSQYSTHVPALETFGKVFEYIPIGKFSSLRAVIQNHYGKEAVEYLNNLMMDLNGGRKDDSGNLVKFTSSLIGNFKKGAVGWSLSTIIQQPAAVIRAMAYINPNYFVFNKEKGINHKDNWDEIKKYAPVAAVKEYGGFDMGLGVNVAEYITEREYKKIGDKVKGFLTDSSYRDNVIMYGASKADEISWSLLWNAVKKEQRKKYPTIERKKLLEKCGERFTKIVNETQVYDSVLIRPEIMRSKGELTKMMTSFMGEPLRSVNIVVDSIILVRRKKISGGQLIRNITTVAVSQIVAAHLASIIYAMRDDDEDESYWEKYWQAYGNKFIDDIMIWNYIPFVKDLSSLAKGYDVSRTDTEVIADIIDSYKEIKKAKTPEEAVEATEKFVFSILKGIGVPVGNIARDIKGIVRTLKNDVDSSNLNTTKAFAEGIFGEKTMSDANEYLAKGKTEKANKLIADLLEEKTEKNISNGKTQEKAEKDAKSSIRSSLTSYWKPLFIKAYQEDDYIEQEEIYERLNSTGIYGTSEELEKTIEKWIKDLQ